MAAPLDRLAGAVARYKVSRFLVHRPPAEISQPSALRPGVRAGGVAAMLATL
jgi:hypothetical protein